MGIQQESVVRDFCAAWGEGRRELPDKDRILALMTEDASWTLWVPGGSTTCGKAAISAEIDRQAPLMAFLQCQIRSIVSTDRTVFTERRDRYVFQGKPVAFDLVAIFELDEHGRISAWREYFDTATVARAMGVEPSLFIAP